MVFKFAASRLDDDDLNNRPGSPPDFPSSPSVASPRACSGCVGRFDELRLWDRSGGGGSVEEMQDENPRGRNGSAGKANGIVGMKLISFWKNFYIPSYILLPDSKVEAGPCTPVCPVLVFINSKSGGQLSRNLLVTYRALLNKHQVFDLGLESPEKVLSRIYMNLEKLKLEGNEAAAKIQGTLKIIVAGGDGTAGWLLGVVSDLKLPHPPAIATVPLGTENNLSFAFGWGKKNPGTDSQSVEAFLEQVMKAEEMKVDSWHILMRMRAPHEGSYEPIAPLDLPHSLHAFGCVSTSDELNEEGRYSFRGGFWNYFSMGMDAQDSYAFHSERKLHPEKFENQLVNQSTYMKPWRMQRWWLFQSNYTDIAVLAKVNIMNREGQWQALHIPHSIRSIICLNLPSFFGGLNPWGTTLGTKGGFTPPYVDDGLIEVVGFRDAWHELSILNPNGHGTRLAQAQRIRFEFHRGATDHTYMRIDGEPWKQPLPTDDDTVEVEISHLRQVKVLATHDCKAKSIHRPMINGNHDIWEDDSPEEESMPEGEEWRKFGAADSFKIPDEVDIARFS